VIPPGGGRVAAAIDVGSNSVLLLAIAIRDDGRARALDEALATTRLGTNLRPGGPLDGAAAERTCRAVVELAQRARTAGAVEVWGFATGAARRASDGTAFVARTSREAGVPIEILTGEREARLAYAAVVHGLGVEDHALVVDVGGATTELTLGRGATIEASASLSIGALTLTETCGEDSTCARTRTLDALMATDLPARARRLGAPVLASGGTPTSLAALAAQLPRYDPRRVHGAILTIGDVASVRAVPDGGPIDPGRAAILPAGACILAGVMDAAGADHVRVSDHGVRHAYLRERLAERGVAVDMRTPWS
jgi:exopolyphosphatase/guanosine-5'-triphosphate,3'-diphosphate pyrophosphatase